MGQPTVKVTLEGQSELVAALARQMREFTEVTYQSKNQHIALRPGKVKCYLHARPEEMLREKTVDGLHSPSGRADEELFESVLAGQLSYVLTSRQMDKSSLMIRIAARLEEAGVKTATLDLSAIDAAVTAQQWYLDVALSIRGELNLPFDLLSWWQAQTGSGPPKRFANFLRDVVLREIEEKIVIFIDEIDSILNLDFADDFFAAIRAIHNAQARNPIYDRLTFVLIGMVTPSDLIQDAKRSPFNICRVITL